jgi:transcription-repair coupling factor (superfamily II helicase)
MQAELEDAFAHVETSDQLTVIDEIKRDMEAPVPMDRLLAGDVGFGKTEVAVRAAAKAVFDGKQVAVLVPTTILAQQHAETFRERFSGFPVVVAELSRFVSPARAHVACSTGWPPARSTSSSARTRCSVRTCDGRTSGS